MLEIIIGAAIIILVVFAIYKGFQAVKKARGK